MELRRHGRQSHAARAAFLGELRHPPNPPWGGSATSAKHLAFILIIHLIQFNKAAQQLPITRTHSANANQRADGGKGGRRGAAPGLTFNPTLNHHTHDRGGKF